ncbi:AraC family transcriptional regulator [Rhizobium pusense]|uniref:AraC family transcriptional regulator n=1 Tax=Agrobacterium pusense TaxID=648995 RepID=UPI001C6F06EA|nr:AraC family transcriptional regulator [Agrobacterium pusense]MBW9080684.1 AraC family transcriptional regulator [Agrobacterium pusense]
MTTIHEIAEAIERRTGLDGSFSTSMPRVFLLRFSEPSALIHTVYEPSICFVAQGRKLVESGRYRLEYAAGEALAVASALPVAGMVLEASNKAPFLGIRIELDLDLLRGFDLGRQAPVRHVHEGLATFQPSQRLEDTILRLLRLLDNPQEIDVLGPLVELELLYDLAIGPSPALTQLAVPGTATAKTAWAADYIRSHWRTGVRLHALADLVHMTERRLKSNFVVLTGQEPAEYQKRLRLQEVRRLLMLGASVSLAAQSAGFASGSAFEAEYMAAFQASPLIDATRLRQLSPLDLEE